MSDVRHRPPRPPRRARGVRGALAGTLALLLFAGLLTITQGPASAKVPRAAARYTASIEPLARYVGQTVCSPAAKPGTSAFANLLLRTYPSSRSMGISRSCSVGGQSEHKEGRAFDWGVSVNRAADRKAVNDLMRWLLRRDRHGNRYAMARRLGIQYMIWNRRIWGAYAAGSGWRRYTGSSPHTDHVHFSLSWAGARKRTSFWNPRNFPKSSGSAPGRPTRPQPPREEPAGPSGPRDYPDPLPDSRAPKALPEPRAPLVLEDAAPLLSETVVLPARQRAGVRTRNALVAGRRYLIEVSGTYRYEKSAGSRADAECSTQQGSEWWQRDRSLRADQWHADHLDVYVDGHDLYAEADSGQACDTKGNTYRWVYEAERSGRVPFAIWDPVRHGDNSGRLTIRVLDLGHVRDTMAWSVPARSPAGGTSPGLLAAGTSYVVTVAGTWDNGRGVVADAECARTSTGGWRRDSDSHDVLAARWSSGGLVPRVESVRMLPVSGGTECDPGSTYSWVYRPDRTSPLNLRVADPEGHGDNTGSLTVSVRRQVTGGATTPPAPTPTPSPTPTPTPTPTPVTADPELLAVDSRSATPVSTVQEHPAGARLRVTVTGAYLMRGGSDWIAADAECSRTSRDATWRSTRYDGWWNGANQPLGDLAVNGSIITWRPVDGLGSCDDGHAYTYDLTTSRSGPLSFVVVDSHYGDNHGSLDVKVSLR